MRIKSYIDLFQFLSSLPRLAMPGCVTKVGEIARLAFASPVGSVGQPQQSLCEAAPPSEMAYCGQLHASEGEAGAQLGDSQRSDMSLGGSVVARIHRQ